MGGSKGEGEARIMRGMVVNGWVGGVYMLEHVRRITEAQK